MLYCFFERSSVFVGFVLICKIRSGVIIVVVILCIGFGRVKNVELLVNVML